MRSVRPDLIVLRAGALSFRTLLSLVPLLAVAFSLFRAFGGLEDARRMLERRLLQNVAPGAAHAVSEQVGIFMERMASGGVSGIGVLLLVLTVVTVLSAIEEAFNALWEVEKPRPILQRVGTYWAMVSVGPVLFALSLSLSSAVRIHPVVTALSNAIPGAAWLFLLVFSVVPWLITCTAMTLLYLLVPHTKVQWSAALRGGLTAGTLWEAGKLVFTWASANLFAYDVIYGGFAALAILLVWLQIGWTIVLLGAKVAWALQHERALEAPSMPRDLGHMERESLALQCMIEIARAFANGWPPPAAEDLAAEARVLELKKEVLNKLETNKLILTLDRKSESAGAVKACYAYVPGRALASITLKDVVDAFRLRPDRRGPSVERSRVPQLVAEWMKEQEDVLEANFGRVTLADVVKRLEGER